MRAAAAAIVPGLPSVLTPLRPARSTRPQKYHQIGWKQLVRLSVWRLALQSNTQLSAD